MAIVKKKKKKKPRHFSNFYFCSVLATVTATYFTKRKKDPYQLALNLQNDPPILLYWSSILMNILYNNLNLCDFLLYLFRLK